MSGLWEGEEVVVVLIGLYGRESREVESGEGRKGIELLETGRVSESGIWGMYGLFEFCRSNQWDGLMLIV